MSQSLNQTFALIKSDMQKRCDYEHKKLSVLRVIRFCLFSATACLVLYRFQVFFYHHHMRPVARILYIINALFLGAVRLDSTAKIGPRFMLLHANSVTIDANVVLGSDCIFAHQNTISASSFFNAETQSYPAPVIGDHLFMGAGSVVMGGITLGNRVQVSANAFVEQNHPDDAVLFGVPARNVNKSVQPKSDEPSQ